VFETVKSLNVQTRRIDSRPLQLPRDNDCSLKIKKSGDGVRAFQLDQIKGFFAHGNATMLHGGKSETNPARKQLRFALCDEPDGFNFDALPLPDVAHPTRVIQLPHDLLRTVPLLSLRHPLSPCPSGSETLIPAGSDFQQQARVSLEASIDCKATAPLPSVQERSDLAQSSSPVKRRVVAKCTMLVPSAVLKPSKYPFDMSIPNANTQSP
jgi:hypothetical protein